MSHKLQLHLLLDHISAKITANAAIGLRSLANRVCGQFIPLLLRTQGITVRGGHCGGGIIARMPMSEYQMLHSGSKMLYEVAMVLHLLSLPRSSRWPLALLSIPLVHELFPLVRCK